MSREHKHGLGRDGKSSYPELGNRLRRGVESVGNVGRRLGRISKQAPIRLIRSRERLRDDTVPQSEERNEIKHRTFAEAMKFVKTTRPTDRQPAAVTQTFDSFIDTVILNHPVETFSYEEGSIEAESHINILALTIPLQDHTAISVSINTRLWNGEQRRNIRLEHIVPGRIGESYNYYHYGNDDVIREYTSAEQNEMDWRSSRSRLLVDGESLEKIFEVAQESRDEIADHQENARFATQMGQSNEYFIEYEELMGLMQLIDMTKPRSRLS